MPSIAGMLVVVWIDKSTGLLTELMPQYLEQGKIESSAHLLFLFLLGNLVCYVASFPILIFHVTRVKDFEDASAKAGCCWLYQSPYMVTLILAVFTLLAATIFKCPYLPYVLVVVFVGYQCW